MTMLGMDAILLGEFFLLVLLGSTLMTLIRWETDLQDNRKVMLVRLSALSSQVRRLKRQVLAVEASTIPDVGSLLSPMTILGLLMRRRKSRKA